MTPQDNVTMAYTKQPLLQQQTPSATVFTNGKKKNNKKCEKEKKRKIKCVIVGDKAVGKTSLAVSYSNDSFPSEYVPTAYDNYNVVVQVDGKPIRIEICDTAGEDELLPLRSLCYPGTDVFMLCFSLVKPASFASACARWAEELNRVGADVVLVGTQADLRSSPDVLHNLKRRGQAPVSRDQALELATRLCAPYVETSAKTCSQLKEAFDLAITVALRRQKRKRKLWKRLCCV